MSTATAVPAVAVPTVGQLELPGQTHVAEGPHDLSGMYMAHHAFRRDVADFAAAARWTPLFDAAAWRALDARWQRFATVLHHHHTTEDTTLWPQLLECVDAAGDRSARETLEAMAAEHQRVDPLLQACGEGFAAMAQDPFAATAEQLAQTTRAAREALLAHLRHEETEALPLLQRHLSAEGWERVEAAAATGIAPRDLPFFVPWAAKGLDPASREHLLAASGRVMRVLLWAFGSHFERGEAVAFRYV
ncbi:hemerythrin domain-containing protein [Blastococcus sp. URHD0036]|uniref:hemerythrin domain-containing protein n=1 Tax=Blastococcus sp. URHD0036 TaxID=1380356 RepID=UPI00068C0824|nr:hemerythrin domain-containing protein [Blastococcus sp. URHD0036]